MHKREGEFVALKPVGVSLHVTLSHCLRIFPPPSQSYYCLLKVNSDDGGDDKELKQYLVCFLSIGKEGLDLYPPRLDFLIISYSWTS